LNDKSFWSGLKKYGRIWGGRRAKGKREFPNDRFDRGWCLMVNLVVNMEE
jgi:hypothetical protein